MVGSALGACDMSGVGAGGEDIGASAGAGAAAEGVGAVSGAGTGAAVGGGDTGAGVGGGKTGAGAGGGVAGGGGGAWGAAAGAAPGACAEADTTRSARTERKASGEAAIVLVIGVLRWLRFASRLLCLRCW